MSWADWLFLSSAFGAGMFAALILHRLVDTVFLSELSHRLWQRRSERAGARFDRGTEMSR